MTDAVNDIKMEQGTSSEVGGAPVPLQPSDQQDTSVLQVVLPMEDFAEDLDCRLGRANGNIFHRRPGVDRVHDGQVMVRLKKKRFIVIDYSIIPHEEDLKAARMAPHISCPPGAGKQKCITPECTKVGVPVLLYDSDPAEPPSLYLRSGLCFTCQRNLNEKRRTQRKRTSTSSNASNQGGGNGQVLSNLAGSSFIYALGPGTKRFKLGGADNAVIELHNEAIILNKPPVDEAGRNAYTLRDGYGFPEIGNDLQTAVRDAASDTERLISAVSSATTATSVPPTASTAADPAATSAAVDAAADLAAAAAAAVAAATGGVSHSDESLAVAAAAAAVPDEATTAAAVDAALATTTPPPPPEALRSDGGIAGSTGTGGGGDISALYDKALSSLGKSMYLLTQWKQSWDAAVAAAVAQETAVVSSADLAEAVASAAAVAAAVGEDASSSNMASLLLAADQRKDGQDNTKQEIVDVVSPSDVALAGSDLANGTTVQAFEV